MIILDPATKDFTLKYTQKLIEKFKSPIGCEFGIAYGGMVESIGKQWKPHNGIIYGCDTFTGHPKELSQHNYISRTCMDAHYKIYGTQTLSYEYQRAELDKQELYNVILIKGLINKNILKNVPILHYSLLDLDIDKSMDIAWEITKNKTIIGSYIFVHDCIPAGILRKWYIKNISINNDFKELEVDIITGLIVLERTKIT